MGYSMSEMIERVAKAAYSSLFLDGDEWPEVSCSVSAEQFRNAARAAIEAMREPTEEMKKSGSSVTWWNGNDDEEWEENVSEYTAADIFRAMIDAALGTDSK